VDISNTINGRRKIWLAIMLLSVMVVTQGCAAACAAACAVRDSFSLEQSVREEGLQFQYPKGKLADNGPYWLSNPGDDQWRYRK